MKILDLKDSHRYNLQFDVDGQFVKRTDNNLPVAKCKNLFKAKFNFIGDEWTGTKTALFAQGEYSKSVVLDDNDECVIPWEFFDTDKNMTIGKVSVSCGDLVTTNCATVKITKSGYQESDASVPPSPDVYQQLIELAEDTKEIAQSVRDDADNGVFDGEEGYSPKVSLTEELDGVTVTVQNKDGQQSAKVKNGKDGEPGKDGGPGTDGITPHIGENGNWHVGDTDTGKPSQGLRGENATDKQVRTAVDAYMEENPVAITVDPTLSQEGQAADAKATGDKILQFTIKNTARGESIVLTDSAEEKLQGLKVFWKSEQLTTTGAQLLDITKIPTPQTGVAYYKMQVEEGKYTLNTKYRRTDQKDLFLLAGEVNTGASSNINGVDSTISRTVESINGYITIGYRKGVNGVNPFDFETMLNKGETALPYEPYTGGKPSPSVEYQQEIVNAGDDGSVEIKVTGKNLFDISKLKIEHDEEKIVIKQGDIYGIKLAENFKENTRYTVSFESYKNDGGSNHVLFEFVYTDGSRSEQYANGFPKKGFTSNANKTIDYLWIRNPWKAYAEITKIQVEKGSERTEYEPYHEQQTVTIQLDRPLTKWDKIEKRDGVWGVVYKSKTVDDLATLVKDSEPIYGNTGEKYFSVVLKDATLNYDYNKVYSEVGLYKKDVQKLYVPRVMLSSFIVGVNDTDTIETAKAHLHYKVIYETDSEEFLPLPKETQTALNNLHTYYPTTAIANSEDCEMEVEYVADTKNYIDNKISANVASIISQYQTNVANLLSLMPDSVQATMIENYTNNILENVEEMKHE